MKKILLSILAVTSILFIIGCTSGAVTTATSTVTESGSTTVQPLAEKWAEAFKQNIPISL